MLSAYYNQSLVIISILVAIMASYTALDMAGRISQTSGRATRLWLLGGALAMGVGIWSMHFVGMLAFRLPIPLGYDVAITMLSLLIAIMVSWLALFIVSQPALPIRRLAIGAVVLGIGISSMHYTGMMAMRMAPGINYQPGLFALSLLIAAASAGAALWIAFRLRKHTRHILLARIGAAAVMGFAIAGMHYTGMAAAQFPFGSVCMAAKAGASPDSLAIMVIIGTVAVLTIALIISVLDARLEARTAVLARSLADANHELLQQALYDNLTKLPNRTLLEDRVRQAIHKAKRVNSHFSLMFIDLDGFKAINDSLGHHYGDLLLVDVAARIKDALRAQDTVARLGGDEFVILAEPANPEDTATIAEKVVVAINRPFFIETHELRISASIGIAVFPADGKDYRQLAINADAAMYHTKRGGRNGYHFFEESMNANAHQQLQLTQDLRAALSRNELRLVYQPKFGALNNEVVGAEALLRWNHPERGTVPPDQFIPLAEKSGTIIQIGEWVLNEACRQMREWYDLGRSGWTIAVNLSALQFAHEQLVDVVKETLERWKLPPECLTLEVTESTAMYNVKASLEILQKISELGVDISIDDFGTGYSSLLYLKRLPATELKIDRAFVNNLGSGEEDAAIVSAIIALGHTLDMRIVAEGVETQNQQKFLRDLGCDTLQGYLLGKPMSPEQLFDSYVRSLSLPV